MRRPSLVRALSLALSVALSALALVDGGCSLLFSVDGFASQPLDGSAADSAVDASSADAPVPDARAPYDGPSYPSVVLADHPLVYVRLDDPPDAAAPANLGSLPLSHAAYAPSGVTLGAPGALAPFDDDPAVALDGVSGNVTLGDAPQLDFDGFASYSVEVWFLADPARYQSGVFERLWGKSTGSGAARQAYAAYVHTGFDLAVERIADGNVGNGSFGFIATGEPDLGKSPPRWFHVVVTFDGPNALERLFVDGVFVSENASNVALKALAGVPFVAGGQGDGGAGVDPTWLKGSLDELSIYDHSLDGARVAAHHAAGVGVAP